MDYHEKLDEVIRTYNLSAKHISEETGISTVNISRYRNGKRKPDPETLQKLTASILHQIAQNGVTLSQEDADSIRASLVLQDSVFILSISICSSAS